MKFFGCKLNFIYVKLDRQKLQKYEKKNLLIKRVNFFQ